MWSVSLRERAKKKAAFTTAKAALGIISFV